MPERFIAYVTCPKCQQKGAAVWEENDNPVYQGGEWGTTLTRVSEGFRPGPAGQIFCAVCDVAAVVGKSGVENNRRK
jgi:uncharacterized Zn finger protein (UPF0148 family)